MAMGAFSNVPLEENLDDVENNTDVEAEREVFSPWYQRGKRGAVGIAVLVLGVVSLSWSLGAEPMTPTHVAKAPKSKPQSGLWGIVNEATGLFEVASPCDPSPPAATPLNPDPSVLKWLNPENAVPGGTVCGFMHAHLGTNPDLKDHYPKVKVYICMRISMNPNPKGVMFGHCGGPGTTSDCGLGWGGVDPDYHAVGIDQRGLGRSLPSFASPECANEPFGDILSLVDESKVRAALKAQLTRQFKCFYGKQYQLEAARPIKMDAFGNVINRRLNTINQTHFNFLQYSGTRQVVEDLERFRIAIGQTKLNVFGVSYGTMIVATYATMFPSSVGKFIMNSPVVAFPNMYKWAWDEARSKQQNYDSMVLACKYVNSTTDLAQVLSNSGIILTDQVCQNLRNGGIIRRLDAPPRGLLDTSSENPDTWAKPTKECPGQPVAGQPDYCKNLGTTAQAIVMSQSTSGNALNEEYFMTQLKKANDNFPYKLAGAYFAYWWGITFGWPRQTPVASMRSSTTKGVIVGFMFDPNTPYQWAQEMHENFPKCNLITSQNPQHGIQPSRVSANNDWKGFSNSLCWKMIEHYLKTGELPNDGMMCSAPASNALSFGGNSPSSFAR